ncbi:hypothetical protein HG536_0D02520 [Torulaspora globosa]|uniref:Protein YIP n=1 Tax=Torulaspora globosa TaxID=48254 RepID=A0A7G3ZGU4_9SACH|nr:uncharacterized protein HG536_0D02520 [Torulaspora globosa]QLL32730.1 hypothetical protein HG536_0D02520 [Torulaspora globosa]
MPEADDNFIEPDVAETAVTQDPVDGVLPISSRGTLDESIFETLKRDVLGINARLKQVVYPHFFLRGQDISHYQNDAGIHCDLWAPLAFIIVYSVSVSRSNARSLFSGLFVSLWAALLIMAVHLRLVKPHEKSSLVSYVSMAGYCLFPLVINSIVGQLILPAVFRIGHGASWAVRTLLILRLLLLTGSVTWSMNSIRIVAKCQSFVEVFPLALCFFGIGWLSVIL